MSLTSSDSNPYEAPQAASTPEPGETLAGEQDGEATAPCPACGHQRAKPVRWTMWGGALGPRVLSHVRCLRCGVGFNSRKGTYNTAGIWIYLTVSLVAGITAGLLLAQTLRLRY